MSDLIYLERFTGTDDELKSLQRIFMSIPSYAQKLTGQAPTEDYAKEILNKELPEGALAENRYFYGIYFNHDMVGCFDLIKSYPDEKSATLNLLVLDYEIHGAGLGSEAFKEIEKMVRDWQGFQRIRIPFVRTLDQVMPFWRKMGFRRTNETTPYEYGEVRSKCVILDKNLNRSAPTHTNNHQSKNQPNNSNNKRGKFSRPRNSGGGQRRQNNNRSQNQNNGPRHNHPNNQQSDHNSSGPRQDNQSPREEQQAKVEQSAPPAAETRPKASAPEVNSKVENTEAGLKMTKKKVAKKKTTKASKPAVETED